MLHCHERVEDTCTARPPRRTTRWPGLAFVATAVTLAASPKIVRGKDTTGLRVEAVPGRMSAAISRETASLMRSTVATSTTSGRLLDRLTCTYADIPLPSRPPTAVG